MTTREVVLAKIRTKDLPRIVMVGSVVYRQLAAAEKVEVTDRFFYEVRPGKWSFMPLAFEHAKVLAGAVGAKWAYRACVDKQEEADGQR